MMPTEQELKIKFLAFYREILLDPNKILQAIITGFAIKQCETLALSEIDSYFDDKGMIKPEAPFIDDRFYNFRQKKQERYLDPSISQREEIILYSVKMEASIKMQMLHAERLGSPVFSNLLIKAAEVLNELKYIKLDSPKGIKLSAEVDEQILKKIIKLMNAQFLAKSQQSPAAPFVGENLSIDNSITVAESNHLKQARDYFQQDLSSEHADETSKDLFKQEMPEHVRLGSVLHTEDDFFDAIAQSLIDMGKASYAIKDLRVICHDYVIALDKGLKKENWIYQSFLAKAEKEKAKKLDLMDEEAIIQQATLNYQHYMANIRYTAGEIKAGEGLNIATAIKGKQNIEGRILREKFGIKLHVVKSSQIDERLILTHQLDGKKIIDGDISYETADTVHIAIHDKVIIPLLANNKAVNPTAENDEAINQQQNNKIKQQQKQRLFHKESLGISMGVMLAGAVLLGVSGTLTLTGIGGALGLPFAGIAAMIIMIGGLKSLYHTARLAFIPSHRMAEPLHQPISPEQEKQLSATQAITSTKEVAEKVSQIMAEKAPNTTNFLKHLATGVANTRSLAQLIIHTSNLWEKKPSASVTHKDILNPSCDKNSNGRRRT